MPPVKPMLAKAVYDLPRDPGLLYEPKWDGFRCVVFRDGDEVELGSRNDRPLTRYFPEMLAPLRAALPERCVVDGELVEFVRDLKHQPGGDIGVHGSISVAQALLAADVVDELRLAIAPTIAGRGRRLLDGLPPIQLESIRSEISPTGYLIVDYRLIREGSADEPASAPRGSEGRRLSS